MNANDGRGCGCAGSGKPGAGECDDAGEPHPCLAAADAILAQADAFVRELDPCAYARPCACAADGTIGKHLRHCLDHFNALLVEAEPIDYDRRERDVPMEVEPRAALRAIAETRDRLGWMAAGSGGLGRQVRIRVMVDADGRTVELVSTLARELAFATHHALHHHAMMKFIAESFGLRTPAGFGRAPSTMNHERRVSATLSSV